MPKDEDVLQLVSVSIWDFSRTSSEQTNTHVSAYAHFTHEARHASRAFVGFWITLGPCRKCSLQSLTWIVEECGAVVVVAAEGLRGSVLCVEITSRIH